MKNSQLLEFLIVVSPLWCLMAQPVVANEAKQKENSFQLKVSAKPSTHAADLLAQNATPTVIKITGVKLNSAKTGLEVVLESDLASTTVPITRSEGNAFIAELKNAILSLPDGSEFQAANPAVGITNVSVVQFDKMTVRVSVIGTEAVPTAMVRVREAIAAEPSVPGKPEAEEEEIVATGEQETGYRSSNSTAATKTNTPIRDIPGSVQVIPRKVLEDQKITRIRDAVSNVSGVTPGGYGSQSTTGESFILRGFDSSSSGSTFINGFKRYTDTGYGRDLDVANIEQIEILKGPASVLYGQGEPGGIVNITTKQPLSTPYYSIEGTIGSFSFYRPTVDLSQLLKKRW